jgi:hypothetical protein
MSSTAYSQLADTFTGMTRGISSPGTIFPTIPTKYDYYFGWGEQGTSTGVLGGAFRSHINPLNTCWLQGNF